MDQQQSHAMFCFDGGLYTAAQMREANADSPELLIWIDSAEVGDCIPTAQGAAYCERVA